MKRCPKCQHPLQEGENVCRECGAQTPQDQPSKPFPTQVSAPWIKLVIAIVFFGAIGLGFFALKPSNDLASAAKEQMLSLQMHDITKAYYNYTSLEFQSRQSLSEFRELLKKHPSWTQHINSSFFGQKIEGQRGVLNATVTSSDGTRIPIIYEFVKENDRWKISNIQFIGGENETEDIAEVDMVNNLSFDKVNEDAAVEIVEEQLKTLRNKEVPKAYFEFVSEDFKDSTSYRAFEAFVANNPILTDHDDVNLESVNVDKEERVTVRTLLFDDNEPYPIDFVLVSEEGKWKVWRLQAHPNQTQKEPMAPSELEDIEKVVQNQLKALRREDVIQAYFSFVSDEFKEATSFKEFQSFVNNYPELTEHLSTELIESGQQDGLKQLKFTLLTERGDSQVEYWLVPQNGTWKIWGINIVESASYPPITEETMEQLTRVIDRQLNAIKDGDFSQAYYAFASSDFEDATTFEQFQEFLENYPIFVEHTDKKIQNGISDGAIKIVRVELISPDSVSDVDFRLINEGGYWKIWGIQILTEERETPREPEIIYTVIKEQIEAIKNEDFSRAYWAFTSRQFQEAASKEQFVEFIKVHPELLTNSSIEFDEFSIKGNIATIRGMIASKDETEKPYEWRLIFEDKKWKILGIQVLAKAEDEKPKSSENAMQFAKADIGTEVNLHGNVTDPKKVINQSDEEITVSIYVYNGAVGDRIEVILEHVESGSKIKPITAPIEKEGDSVISFIFSPPSQGWPDGQYQVHTTSTSGAKETFHFSVE